MPGSSVLKGNAGSMPNSASNTRSEGEVTSPVRWFQPPVTSTPSCAVAQMSACGSFVPAWANAASESAATVDAVAMV